MMTCRVSLYLGALQRHDKSAQVQGHQTVAAQEQTFGNCVHRTGDQRLKAGVRAVQTQQRDLFVPQPVATIFIKVMRIIPTALAWDSLGIPLNSLL
jgi:hypothetical protein